MTRKKSKVLRNIAIIGALAVFLIIGSVMFFPDVFLQQDAPIGVKLLDKDFNQVGFIAGKGESSLSEKSIVGGVPFVEYIQFVVRIKNTGEIEFNSKVIDANPSELKNAFPTSKILVPVGETRTIESSPVAVSKYEGKTINFSVKLENSYMAGSQQAFFEKEASISLTITKDPIVGADVTIESSVGTSGSGVGNSGKLSSGSSCNINSQCSSGECLTKSQTGFSLVSAISEKKLITCSSSPCKIEASLIDECLIQTNGVLGRPTLTKSNPLIFNKGDTIDPALECFRAGNVLNLYQTQTTTTQECK